MAYVSSVNVGRPQPNAYKETSDTGIGKQPVDGPIEVRAPGPKRGGLGSGVVGDFIGDVEHHGGEGQAVYAFAREDLDRWETELGRTLPNGYFGENLTTVGLDVNEAVVGERWTIGPEVVLQVVSPRIPCSTFRGWLGVPGWLRTFTADGRPGAYLSVVTPGQIRAGDAITVVHRPQHGVTISLFFAALTLHREYLPDLLPAAEDLEQETLDDIDRYLSQR